MSSEGGGGGVVRSYPLSGREASILRSPKGTYEFATSRNEKDWERACH